MGEGWRETANEYGVSFWGDEYVLKVDRGDGCTPCEYSKNQ